MSSFRLHSEDSGFNNRVDALFSSLQTVAVDLKPEDAAEGGSNTKRDEGDDFRKPQARPPSWRGGRGRGRGSGPRNSTPDYVKNPRNWTRYSMKDTRTLSDRENKQEGLKLFQELRARREEEEDDKEPAENKDEKIVFKKPSRSEPAEDKKEEPDMSADAMFGGTKRLHLPEYVVGTSKKKSKKSPSTEGSTKKADAIKLNHLMFEDEEETE